MAAGQEKANKLDIPFCRRAREAQHCSGFYFHCSVCFDALSWERGFKDADLGEAVFYFK